MHLDRSAVSTAAAGAVVSTEWLSEGSSVRIIFDAVTGHVLWTSADDNDFTSDDPEYLLDAPASSTLVARTDTDVRGYDPRTGARRWATPVTDRDCRGSDLDSRVTAHAVYVVVECGSAWRIIAIDPGTGLLIGQRDLPTSHNPTLTQLQNTVVVDFSTAGADPYLLVDTPDELATTPLRTSVAPFAAATDGSEFLVESYDQTTRRRHVDLTTADGTTSTRVPDMTARLRDSGAVHILSEHIVELEYDTSLRLSLWPRRNPTSPTTIPIDTKCRPKAAQPILLPAPASILVVCQNNEEIGDATLDIIGYR